MTIDSTELAIAQRAASRGADVLRQHYQQDSRAFTAKADDSPLTAADLAANEAILATLGAAFPDDAILSEESADSTDRLAQRRVWIVDPMDGTRDFVASTGNFAVHVALAVDGEVVAAAVAVPVTHAIYYAALGGGAFRKTASDRPQRLAVTSPREPLRVGISATTTDPRLLSLGDDGSLQLHRIGASIKMLQIAEGQLDASLCLTPSEHEWDTAAPGLIVREAGGLSTDIDGAGFTYNRKNPRHLRGIVMGSPQAHSAVIELLNEAGYVG